jgi:hypothetical protein
MGRLGCPEMSVNYWPTLRNIPEVPRPDITLIYSSLLQGNVFTESSFGANEKARKQ